MRIAHLEAGHRVQLPAEWVSELNLENGAVLEKTPEGILIHSRPRLTWDEIFATKLSAERGTSALESEEVTGDDLLF